MLISTLYKYQESSDVVPKISSHGFLKEVKDLALDDREVNEKNSWLSANKLKFRRFLLLQMDYDF